jgi:integrase
MDYVIGTHFGDIRHSFTTAVALSGIDKHVTPHTLKHTAATWIVQGGASLWDAAGFLATSVRTMERVYAHHAPEHQGRALEAFDVRKTRRNGGPNVTKSGRI